MASRLYARLIMAKREYQNHALWSWSQLDSVSDDYKEAWWELNTPTQSFRFADNTAASSTISSALTHLKWGGQKQVFQMDSRIWNDLSDTSCTQILLKFSKSWTYRSKQPILFFAGQMTGVVFMLVSGLNPSMESIPLAFSKEKKQRFSWNGNIDGSCSPLSAFPAIDNWVIKS